ncbi:DNA-binding protein [Leifsonia shinshuensis]|uniref:DNA-binding protein n=1 Tax=Leifsonia shinshuensis TaxID=150026 RepID=A0A7G6Y925_9MICO|nr:DNA-binding protein [Leifsonia shinshuensis]QNE34990.1 DNA-binding protein [Leifsonia shinshuensis]
MFVVTADQVDSRNRPDIVAPALSALNERHGERLALPADRNAGDELQALTADAATAFDIVTTLARGGAWSVGIGIGAVRTPLPAATREASGDAFVAARAAVTRAKRAPLRFAAEAVAAPEAAADVEALVGLLLTLRETRSAAGWELYDLVAAGLTQAEAGARLGITPQSANDRARAAGLRADLAAQPALVRLLETADAAQQSAERPEDG